MRSIFAPLMLVSCHLSAGLQKIQLEMQPEERSNLDPRQYLGGNCSSTDTCSECYGPGNVICSYIACFDPSTYEQCCADASGFSPMQEKPSRMLTFFGGFCVAANNSCCGSIVRPIDVAGDRSHISDNLGRAQV
jgi:hypothetical protein